jgi:ribonuclease HII
MGISEAGKASIIGPIVIGAIVVDNTSELESLDFRNKLKHLKEKIDSIPNKQCFKIITPSEIDKNNVLEFEINCIVQIILDKLPDIVFIDAPVSCKYASNFKKKIKNLIPKNVNIIIKNKSKRKCSIIYAANIIAKIQINYEINKIYGCWGDFGSGYSNDQKTIKFLDEWYNNNGNFPKHVRKSSDLIKNILKNKDANMYKLLEE